MGKIETEKLESNSSEIISIDDRVQAIKVSYEKLVEEHSPDAARAKDTYEILLGVQDAFKHTKFPSDIACVLLCGSYGIADPSEIGRADKFGDVDILIIRRASLPQKAVYELRKFGELIGQTDEPPQAADYRKYIEYIRQGYIDAGLTTEEDHDFDFLDLIGLSPDSWSDSGLSTISQLRRSARRCLRDSRTDYTPGNFITLGSPILYGTIPDELLPYYQKQKEMPLERHSIEIDH